MEGRRAGERLTIAGAHLFMVALASAVLVVTSCYSENVGPDPRRVGSIEEFYWGETVEVAVGDSTGLGQIRVTNTAGEYIGRRPTVVIADTSIATARLEEWGDVVSLVWVTALKLGRTTLTLEVDTVRREFTLLTSPASIRIDGLPDSLRSLETARLTATPLDAQGEEMPGLPITWVVPDYVGEISPQGVLTATQARDGYLIVRVEPPDESYGAVQEYLPFRVHPTSFPGTIAPEFVRPGQRVTLTVRDQTNASYSVADIGLEPQPFSIPAGVGARTVVFPAVDTTGVYQLRVEGDRFTSVNPIEVISLAPIDELEPNDDPLTAPAAANGYHVIALSGACGAGLPLEPGADCSDFLTVTNTTTDTIGVSAQVEWRSRMDVDVLWTDEAFTTTVGDFDGPYRFSGPGGEGSYVRIPPGVTWRIWINVHESYGVPYDVLLLRIDGIR